MKKLVSLLVLVAMLFAVCSAVAEPLTVAVVYSDTIDDKGWCQAMHDGINKVIEMGYEIEYKPVESVAIPDAKSVLDQLADEYDIIIVHGAQFLTACLEVAEEYPEQIFAVGTSDQTFGENVFSYMPQSEEPGYVDGVIAGLTTKANKVGIVGSTDGGDSARFVRGFVLGLQSVNPACEYKLSWTNSFSDVIGAGEIARTFIEGGCDVMTGASQQAVGAIRAADSVENVQWVGQTLSQLYDFSNTVIAAGDYDYSAVLLALIEETANGVTGGKCIPMNYNNNGFVFEFSDKVPADVKAAAEAALANLTAQADTIAWSEVNP